METSDKEAETAELGSAKQMQQDKSGGSKSVFRKNQRHLITTVAASSGSRKQLSLSETQYKSLLMNPNEAPLPLNGMDGKEQRAFVTITALLLPTSFHIYPTTRGL